MDRPSNEELICAGRLDDDGESGDDGESEEESVDPEGDGGVPVSVDWIQNPTTTIRMLKGECRRVGLKMCGKKQEVVQRLLDYLYNNNEL